MTRSRNVFVVVGAGLLTCMTSRARHRLEWCQRALEFCRKLPKIELHAHLNGCIRLKTLKALCKKQGLVFPEKTLNGVDLTNVWGLFGAIHAAVVTPTIVTQVTEEVVGDFARDGVVYLELRTTPRRDLMSAETYVAAVINGLKSYEKQAQGQKMTVRLLLSINRAQSTETALATVELAAKLYQETKWVVGIDFSGNPSKSSFIEFRPALSRARTLGLPVAVHCAEIKNDDEVSDMISFAPERLGHALMLNRQHVDRLLRFPIPIEVCPTSNKLTLQLSSHSAHPTLPRWLRHGYNICLCTDDTVFGTSLSYEYFHVARAFGLNDAALLALAHGALEYIFDKDKAVKSALQIAFEAFSAQERIVLSSS